MEEKIAKLEELYGSIGDLTPDNMDSLVADSIHTFEQILEKLQSGTEEEKAKAKEYAIRLRAQLEKQAEKALSSLKVSQDELEAFASNKENFTEEEWKALSKAKEELKSYREHVKNTNTVDEIKKTQSDPKKPKAKQATWIAG